MTDSERLNEVLKHLKMSAKELSEALGFTRPNALYNILNGKNGISRNLTNRITLMYPIFNSDWVRYGRGEMLSKKKRVSMVMEDHARVNEEVTPYTTDFSRLVKSIETKDKQIKFLQDLVLTKDRDVTFLQDLIKDKLKIT